MTPFYTDDAVTVFHGDCLEVLASLPDCSVDSVVTDPPAGIGFMGREWDHHKGGREQWIAWLAEVMVEALRVVKPGGHAFVWAMPRTSHWTATALEDAGWDIRDCVVHLFGSGFPKSLDVSKAIDKAAGAEPIDLGESPNWRESKRDREKNGQMEVRGENAGRLTAPATPDAQRWQGWGTALKPASEHWWLARKPLAGTVAANVLAHGTGALNVDGCRVEAQGRPLIVSKSEPSTGILGDGLNGSTHGGTTDQGRWPSNVVLDESQAAELDRQSGVSGSGTGAVRASGVREQRENPVYGTPNTTRNAPDDYGDSGGASRFFPVFCNPPQGRPADKSRGVASAGEPPTVRSAPTALTPDFPTFRYEPKAPTTERPRVDGMSHATVKPLDLMRWLVRLVTPPGGTVLEPFAGSGTTAEACVVEGFKCVAIEREADYLPLIVQRLTKPIQVALEFD